MQALEPVSAPTAALVPTATDPVGLAAIVQAATAQELLTGADFDTYCDAEVALERILMDRAELSLAAGDLPGARQDLLSVRDLNVSMVALTTRIMKNLAANQTFPADVRDAQVASLGHIVSEADLLAKWVEGRAEVLDGMTQRLQGNPASSIEAFERALRIFDSIPENSRLREQVLVQRAVARYNSKVAHALQDMVNVRYQDAMSGFLEARAEIKRMLGPSGPLASLPFPDELERAKAAEMIESDLLSVVSLYDLTLFFGSLSEGNFRLAGEATKRLVAQAKLIIEKLRAGGAPDLIVRLQISDQGMNEGWNSYAAAELSIDEQKWELALDLLEQARGSWTEAAAEAIGTGLPQGRAMADKVLSQTSIVLQQAGRRCRRERELHQVIAELEAKLAQAKRINIEMTGDLTMNDEFVGGNKITGDAVGGDKIGGDKTVAGRDVIQDSDVSYARLWQQHAGTIDLPLLANELGDLRLAVRKSAAAAAHSEEIRAVDEAEVAAKTGDGPSALKWLKKAGSWALDLGTKVGTDVAIAAAKSALGL